MAGVSLGHGNSLTEWVYLDKSCPTLTVGIAPRGSQPTQAQLVVEQPVRSGGAFVVKTPLQVGFGEPHPFYESGAVARMTTLKLRPRNREGLFTISSSGAQRRQSATNLHFETWDSDPHGETFAAHELLWVRVDPFLEIPMRVVRNARRDQPLWSGLPKNMCTHQLERDSDVASQQEAARALSTYHVTSSIRTLYDCLADDGHYFRVRIAAVQSLSLMESQNVSKFEITEQLPLSSLLVFLQSTYFANGQIYPNDFSDVGNYEVLKALVEALGTFRANDDFTPPVVIAGLLEFVRDNDNSLNEYDDDYLMGALLRAVAATSCRLAGRVSLALIKQIGWYLHFDKLMPSHDMIISRCSLQALCTLDLSGCRPADWHVYHHYERYGGTASLRLTAADCVLRLSLLLNVMGLGQGRGRCDPARDTVNVWADCGWCCHGINEKMNVRTRPVLAIAVQFGERRSHNPLEQLRLWASMHCLLSSRLVRGTPLAIQRKRLASRGGAESSAAAQLLWRMMRSGAAGHPGLRCVLCEVWRDLFADRVPGCLALGRRDAGYVQLLPSYTPWHATEACRRAAEMAACADAERKASAENAKVKVCMMSMGMYPTEAAHTALNAPREEVDVFSSGLLVRSYRSATERNITFVNAVHL